MEIFRRWEAIERRLPAWFERGAARVPKAAVALGGVLLVAGFAAQLALLAYQAGHDGVRPGWFSTLPYALVDDAAPFGGAHPQISFAALAFVLVQSIGLTAVVAAFVPERSRADRDAAWALVLCAAGALGAFALFAPAIGSSDMFGYVGLGLLGAHPFERPAHFFTGEYARFFASYPLRPTVYGPLWIGLNAALVSLGGTFAAKLFVLRAFGATQLLALAALVWSLARSRALTAAVLLNPMLWLQFVVNAHNDLMAVTLVAGGVALVARRHTGWAIAAIAAAGLVKLPFLLLGVVAFGREGRRRALLSAGSAVAVCVAISAVFGGKPYLDALLTTTAQRGIDMDPVLQASKIVMALTPVFVTAYVLLKGRYPAFGGWLYPALAPILFPWYLVWAVPYALAARAGALLTLLALPLVATLVDTIYDLHVVALALFALGMAGLLAAVARQAPEALEPASG
jgi:hypothetical protein